MNLWDQPGIPHKGWQCVDVIDIFKDDVYNVALPDFTSVDRNYETCQMCGRENIRYVHVMEHNEYDSQLRVGCVCAQKMSGDYVGPRDREQKLKNRAARRSKWFKRSWRVSTKGNHFLNIDGHNVSVFPDKYRKDKWGFCINNQFSKERYNSRDQAKMALFEAYCRIIDG